jgi:hypothetical protein
LKAVDLGGNSEAIEAIVEQQQVHNEEMNVGTVGAFWRSHGD